MKLFILSICFYLTSTNSHSQQTMLLGTSEKYVRNYMDSLFSLKNNKYYKIEQQTTPQGDLMLIAEFSIFDFDFYKCSTIMALFQRINGNEICTRQMITGRIQYAQLYLSFIKDNFKYISENKWEFDYTPDHKIEAEYGKMKEDFYITYTIRDK